MTIIFQTVNIILSRNMLNDNNKRGFRLLIGNNVYCTVYIYYTYLLTSFVLFLL